MRIAYKMIFQVKLTREVVMSSHVDPKNIVSGVIL